MVAAERAGAELDRARWDALADELGPRARARVTFIDADGIVLGDSEVAARRARSASRTTAIAPRSPRRCAGDAGQSSMRWSATIHERLMYAAVPLALGERRRGAARLAVPLAEVDAAVSHLRRLLVVALGVALVVAIVVSSAAAQVLSRALRRMTDGGAPDVGRRPRGAHARQRARRDRRAGARARSPGGEPRRRR